MFEISFPDSEVEPQMNADERRIAHASTCDHLKSPFSSLRLSAFICGRFSLSSPRAGLLLALCLLTPGIGGTDAVAQTRAYTRADTLRGSITPERAWWDVTFYDLHI